MKIVFDEDDEFLEKRLSVLSEDMYLIPSEGSYSINFRVSDPIKASVFMSEIFHNKDTVQYLKENAGFEITSINYYTALNGGAIKDKLKSIIEDIEAEEVRLR